VDERELKRRAKVVARWRASRQPAAEFAACEGLKASQLYSWSRRAGAAGDPERREFTELRLRDGSSVERARADGPGQTTAIEIQIGDITVRVRAGADLELLAAVLGVVSRC
jgi:hypothetical protein